MFLQFMLNANNYFYLIEQTKKRIMENQPFKQELICCMNTLAVLRFFFPKEREQLFKTQFLINQIVEVLPENDL